GAARGAAGVEARDEIVHAVLELCLIGLGSRGVERRPALGAPVPEQAVVDVVFHGETTIGVGTARLERSNGFSSAREHVDQRRAPPNSERSGEHCRVTEARRLNAGRTW